MPFTCYSDTHLGCGSLHRSRKAAAGCCRVAERRFGELRDVKECADRAELAEFYPASPEAAARYAEWAAKNGVKPHSEGDAPKTDAGKPESSPAEPQPTQADDSAPGKADDSAPGKVKMSDEAEPQPADAPQTPDSGDAAHPLAGLAGELTPLLTPPIMEATAALIDEGLKGAAPRRIEVTTPDQPEPISLDGEQHEKFDLLLKLVGAGENVFMSGPAGSGKTTAAANVAKALGMDLIVQPVALDKFEATGFIDAGGSYRESAVYRWAKAEKPSLLLLDEVDGWMPQALVALNPVLDNRLGIFPGGQQFDIDPRHRVISTANTWGLGADAEYVGRNRLDAASLDRFGARLDWGYDEGFERRMVTAKFGDHGQRAVDASQAVRAALSRQGVKVLWGPRQTLGLAARLAVGMSLPEAFEVSALAQLQPENRKRVLDGIVDAA